MAKPAEIRDNLDERFLFGLSGAKEQRTKACQWHQVGEQWIDNGDYYNSKLSPVHKSRVLVQASGKRVIYIKLSIDLGKQGFRSRFNLLSNIKTM